MKQCKFEILDNYKISKDIYKMSLCGDTSEITAPGQFINIKLDNCYLRRPISICDYDKGFLTIVYKVVGVGTDQMTRLKVGEKLDILIGLGNGFDYSNCGENPLIIGGGVGIPPLYNLCKAIIKSGITPTVILGYNSKEEMFLEADFMELGCNVHIATADGSVGEKGFVTDIMGSMDFSYFFTCGPMPMFKAIDKIAKTSGQYSFEERMGCGFGACMGCTCATKLGYKRICKEGPVMHREEVTELLI